MLLSKINFISSKDKMKKATWTLKVKEETKIL